MGEQLSEQELSDVIELMRNVDGCKVKRRWSIVEVLCNGETRVLCRSRKRGFRFESDKFSNEYMPVTFKFKFFAWLKSLRAKRRMLYGSHLILCKVTMIDCKGGMQC